jgi:hypothetical protein
MIPAIWPGDEVTVRQCAFAEFEPGQIALFHRGGKLTAHRIQVLKDGAMVTRGDSIACFDAPVRAGEIVGRVESICRGGRAFNPEQRAWQRVAAWILRKSDFCMRATLYVSRRLRPTWDMRASFLPKP